MFVVTEEFAGLWFARRESVPSLILRRSHLENYCRLYSAGNKRILIRLITGFEESAVVVLQPLEQGYCLRPMKGLTFTPL